MNDINRVLIGQKLRKLRGTRTIQDVANDTGIAWSNICSYEHGHRMPDDDKKVILARYFGVSVQDIFFDDGITESDVSPETITAGDTQ